MLSRTLRQPLWHLATWLKLLTHRQWPAWWRFRTANFSSPAPRAAAGRRLLLLTWEFPPQVTGGVYRPLSFVRHAAASGWQAEVVCGPASDRASEAGQYLAGLVPEELPVTRAVADFGPHPWPLPKIDGGIMQALSLFETAKARIKPGEGGVILASGPPFSSFVAGFWLARHTGWKLVLDYRDEWTLSPFKFVDKTGANPAWEKRCLAQADMVIFTTPSQLAQAQGLFHELTRPIATVIYNGWEPCDFALTPSACEKTPDTPIILAYLGNLGGMAAIDPFLDSLASALTIQPDLRRKIRIRLVGHKRPEALKAVATFPFPEVLELLDSIPKQQACSMMSAVDGLLLLNPVELQRYIQGKLYEYMASGTPILVFGEGGEMGGIVNDLEAGIIVAAGDATALAQAFLNLRLMQNKATEKRLAWLSHRVRKVLATELYLKLDSITNGTKRH